jgi:hypothetical protein
MEYVWKVTPDSAAKTEVPSLAMRSACYSKLMLLKYSRNLFGVVVSRRLLLRDPVAKDTMPVPTHMKIFEIL